MEETRQCKHCGSVLPLSEFTVKGSPYRCTACNRTATNQHRNPQDKRMDLSGNDWQRIKQYFEYRCAYCGVPVDDPVMEHFIPLSNPLSPGHVPWNVVTSCSTCNHSKSNHDPDEWLPRKFGAVNAAQIFTRITMFFEDARKWKEKPHIYYYRVFEINEGVKIVTRKDRNVDKALSMQKPISRQMAKRLAQTG